MPRACARESTRSDGTPEQTHDDCEWLNEEDRQEDVSWNRRAMDRRLDPPAVGQHERWGGLRKDDSGTENRSGNRRHSGRIRGVRLVALRGGTARIGLRLSDEAVRTGPVGGALVHRAIAALRTAGHSGLRRSSPPRTHRRVPGDEAETQHYGGEAAEETHDVKNA
jgi:hypothetical protein